MPSITASAKNGSPPSAAACFTSSVTGNADLPRIRLGDAALGVDRLDEDVALREAAVRRLEHRATRSAHGGR